MKEEKSRGKSCLRFHFGSSLCRNVSIYFYLIFKFNGRLSFTSGCLSCLFLAAGASCLHVCVWLLSVVQSLPTAAVCPIETSSADICPSILCIQSNPYVPHRQIDRVDKPTIRLISVLVGAASCLFHMHGCPYCLSPRGSVSCSLPFCLSSLSLEALHHVCPSGRASLSLQRSLWIIYSIFCQIYSMHSRRN
jgi:hypothetical protein